ncbi:MAG: hypothetical protein FWE15_18925 [Actinomycetia bacterium]|nr:hypothetical protein [Actinomycetes bacterium]
MPTVTIPRRIHEQEAVAALSRRLGSGYTVEPFQREDKEGATVRHGVMSYATVGLSPEGSGTKLRVHGGGLIISRLVNEMGIARTVATAARDAFDPGADGRTCTR